MTLPGDGRDGSPAVASAAGEPEQMHDAGAAGPEIDIERAASVLGQLLPLVRRLREGGREGGAA